jgi:hypothetical protein
MIAFCQWQLTSGEILMDTVVGITGAILMGAAFDVLFGWLLWRWCRKFTPYSKTATLILCFFPLINVWVTFPLMAGKEVGWKDGNIAGAIFIVIFCTPVALVFVAGLWLARKWEIKKANDERQSPEVPSPENI